MRFTLVAAILLIVAGLGWLAHTRHGLTPGRVAAKAHASSCADSGYVARSALGGGAQTVYDCLTGGRERCVTVAAGVASDATVQMRFLFAHTAFRPACARTT